MGAWGRAHSLPCSVGLAGCAAEIILDEARLPMRTSLADPPLVGPQRGLAGCAAGIMPDGGGVPTGTPLADPPLIEAIAEDPVLRNTKMIAEAWDCDGLNQVSGGGVYWDGNQYEVLVPSMWRRHFFQCEGRI